MIALAASALLKMLWSSIVAGVGAVAVFALAVFGAVRASDMRRADRRVAGTAYAALGACGVVLSVAVVVLGLLVVARKV